MKSKPKPKAARGPSGSGKAKAKNLAINKETISSLSDEDLEAVKGGRAIMRTATCAACENPTANCKAAFFSVGCIKK